MRKLEPASVVRVSFVDFWPGFNPHAFLIPLLEAAPFHFTVQVVKSGGADIELHSVFSSSAKRFVKGVGRRTRRLVTGRTAANLGRADEPTSEAIRIWLSGENIRPPYQGWDATLSFDPDSQIAKNAYFPLWWQMFPELIGGGRSARPGIVRVSKFLPLETFLMDRNGEAGQRTKFACAIISNPESTRMCAIRALQELGPVDVFGRVTGQPISDKFEVFRDYQFAVCFESDTYPGYVTEKLFDAWGAGCIPLWWGLDRGSHLNSNAFVNLAETTGVDGFIAEVERLHRDSDARNEMSSLRVLSQRPTLDSVRSLLAHVLLGFRPSGDLA